jgi:hypothetical protein
MEIMNYLVSYKVAMLRSGSWELEIKCHIRIYMTVYEVNKKLLCLYR